MLRLRRVVILLALEKWVLPILRHHLCGCLSWLISLWKSVSVVEVVLMMRVLGIS